MGNKWEGEAGLLSDYDGVIVDAAYIKDNAEYGINLHLYVVPIDAEHEDEEQQDARYGCGNDWDSLDGGFTVEHPRNKGSFNNQTGVIELFKAAFAAGAGDELERRDRELYEEKGHLHSQTWVGLCFHFEVKTETRKFKDRNTGEDREITTNRLLPTSYLGVAEIAEGEIVSLPQSVQAGEGGRKDREPGDTPSRAKAVKDVPDRQDSEPVGSTNGSSDPLAGIDAPTAARIKVAAKSQPHHEWVDTVLALDGVATNDALVRELADEKGLYTTLKNG